MSEPLIALRAFWTAESTFAKAWLRSSSVKPSLSRISWRLVEAAVSISLIAVALVVGTCGTESIANLPWRSCSSTSCKVLAFSIAVRASRALASTALIASFFSSRVNWLLFSISFFLACSEIAIAARLVGLVCATAWMASMAAKPSPLALETPVLSSAWLILACASWTAWLIFWIASFFSSWVNALLASIWRFLASAAVWISCKAFGLSCACAGTALIAAIPSDSTWSTSVFCWACLSFSRASVSAAVTASLAWFFSSLVKPSSRSIASRRAWAAAWMALLAAGLATGFAVIAAMACVPLVCSCATLSFVFAALIASFALSTAVSTSWISCALSSMVKSWLSRSSAFLRSAAATTSLMASGRAFASCVTALIATSPLVLAWSTAFWSAAASTSRLAKFAAWFTLSLAAFISSCVKPGISWISLRLVSAAASISLIAVGLAFGVAETAWMFWIPWVFWVATAALESAWVIAWRAVWRAFSTWASACSLSSLVKPSVCWISRRLLDAASSSS